MYSIEVINFSTFYSYDCLWFPFLEGIKCTEHAQSYSLTNVRKSERKARVKGNVIGKGIEVISLLKDDIDKREIDRWW